MKCLNCKKKTIIWAGKPKLYCDISCRDGYYSKKNKKNYKEKECLICESKFKPSAINSKYCSGKCGYDAELKRRSNKPDFKECGFCKNTFVPYSSIDKFCSANCRVDNMKSKRGSNWSEESVRKRSGKNNPAYRTGFSKEPNIIKQYKQKEYLRIRNKKREDKINEYGYLFCDRCNKSNPSKFEMHHIVFRSEKPQHKHLHNPKNLIDLCVQCHNDFHKVKSSRGYLIKERKLTELFGNSILNKS